MLKPRLKTKLNQEKEIIEKQNINNKRKIFFGLLILFIVSIIFNNVYNNMIIKNKKDKVLLDNLDISFYTDKNTYNIGEKIRLYVSIKNISSKTVELKFKNSDIVYITIFEVIDLGVTKFYKQIWSNKKEQEIFNPYSIKLKPFEKMTFTTIWDQKDKNGNLVKTGYYRFKAELNTLQKIELIKETK